MYCFWKWSGFLHSCQLLLLCDVSLQDVSDHSSLLFPVLYRSQYISHLSIIPKTESVIRSLRHFRYVMRRFPLSLLPPICPVPIKVLKNSFLLMPPRNFSCLFRMQSITDLFVSIVFRTCLHVRPVVFSDLTIFKSVCMFSYWNGSVIKVCLKYWLNYFHSLRIWKCASTIYCVLLIN